MAGVKFICKDCKREAWFPRRPVYCPSCEGINMQRAKVVELDEKKCVICETVFKPVRPKQLTCCDKCNAIRRYDVDSLRRNRENLGSTRCKYCGGVFKKKNVGHSICSAYACQLKRVNDNNAKRRRRVVDTELLGPEEPTMPLRKCHDCKALTYDYRCDSCRAKWRAKNFASGLSGMRELFSGAYIPQQGSGVLYG